MAKRYGVIIAVLSVALIAMALGCGGATGSTDKAAQTKVDQPFGSAGDPSELKGDTSSAFSDGGGFSEEDLQVPGSQYKMEKNPGVESAQHCPKGKKGKKCREDAKRGIPDSEGIAEQMAGIPWGMHYKAVMKKYEDLIQQSYSDLLKEAGGAIEEDRIRTKMMREVRALRDSYVRFDGNRTGYEGVMIEAEFTHNNNESMLVWDAGKFVEYLFFFNDRFWKRLRSFRKDSFQADITFDDYIQTLVNRFGEGKRIENETGELIEIKWKNEDTYMSASDRSGFYGVYCLVLMARVTQDNLAKLRTSASDKGSVKDEQVSSVVESVTSGDLVDHNTSVIDSFTGKETSGSGSSSVQSHHSVIKGSESGKSGEDKPAEEEKKEEDIQVDDIF